MSSRDSSGTSREVYIKEPIAIEAQDRYTGEAGSIDFGIVP
jgi:hypothetical protein